MRLLSSRFNEMSATVLILQCFALFPIAGHAVRMEENEKAMVRIAFAHRKIMFEPNHTALELAFSKDSRYHFADPTGKSYKLLGQGVEGAVFHTLFKLGGDSWHLAVKQFRDDEQANEETALQVLQGSPFVVQIVDIKTTATYHYLVLWPMARGYDNQVDVASLLSARNGGDDRLWELSQNGKQGQIKGLEPQELQFTLAQIALALHSTHANGVSHNDIHVGQFLLDGVLSPEHANVPKVFLADFGLSSLPGNGTESANNEFFSDWAFFGSNALMMCNGAGVDCATQYAFCTRDNADGDIHACAKEQCSRDDLLSCPNIDLVDLLVNWCFSGPIVSHAIDRTSDFTKQFWSHPFWEGIDWQYLKALGSSSKVRSLQNLNI